MAGARAAAKFGSHLKELRLHLCQKSAESAGAREFVMKHYRSVKNSNPNLPILIRECSGVQPKVYARYEFGKESHAFTFWALSRSSHDYDTADGAEDCMSGSPVDSFAGLDIF
ncbi:hypothetical protein MRX96_027234 [Rhipicephalus microplus]